MLYLVHIVNNLVCENLNLQRRFCSELGRETVKITMGYIGKYSFPNVGLQTRSNNQVSDIKVRLLYSPGDILS